MPERTGRRLTLCGAAPLPYEFDLTRRVQPVNAPSPKGSTMPDPTTYLVSVHHPGCLPDSMPIYAANVVEAILAWHGEVLDTLRSIESSADADTMNGWVLAAATALTGGYDYDVVVGGLVHSIEADRTPVKCRFPGCTGTYHANPAIGETGWRFASTEADDVPAHDHYGSAL